MKLLERIDEELAAWLLEQHIFFVATAPLDAEGHVNCSPKGGDCFRILDDHTVAYADYTGSGAKTSAHLRENGRIVVMFCAFDGKPNIVRLHGEGAAITPDNPRYGELISLFPVNAGTRAVVLVNVTRVSTSCGFSVPLMDYRSDREVLNKWAVSKGQDGLIAYRTEKNTRSIDGLPALDAAYTEAYS